jgi:hypothetical protein
MIYSAPWPEPKEFDLDTFNLNPPSKKVKNLVDADKSR